MKLPYSFAKRHRAIFYQSDEQWILAFNGKNDPNVVLEVSRLAPSCIFTIVHLSDEQFNLKFSEIYHSNTTSNPNMVSEISEELDLDKLAEQLPRPQDLLESQDDAPIIKLMNAILTQAIKAKASDIHIETFEQQILIRFRLDGVLKEILSLPRAIAPLLTSRIKIMARLDIAEKRLPQDGRITLHIAGHQVDVRVSTLPSNHGERTVLRLLDKKVAHLELLHLGMLPKTLEHAEKLLTYPNGIILVTGPTGAGKTTSLYAMLNRLNQPTRNILTVEDPIEYDLPGIGQTQVNTKIDMSFAKGLRAILRQDPDVVMIGEIRDIETAEIAVQASLTGHLVLSTLHTNSAIGAITRLRDMGVESFLLASSLIGLLAQRLIRLLCPQCKEIYLASEYEKEYLKQPLSKSLELYRAKGCESCHHSGYHGRSGIYEIILLDETLKHMIHEHQSELTMTEYAHQHFHSLHEDGLQRVLQGDTSLEEIFRVTAG